MMEQPVSTARQRRAARRPPQAGQLRRQSRQIDPALVEAVAERVLALLEAELRSERERDRRPDHDGEMNDAV